MSFSAVAQWTKAPQLQRLQLHRQVSIHCNCTNCEVIRSYMNLSTAGSRWSTKTGAAILIAALAYFLMPGMHQHLCFHPSRFCGLAQVVSVALSSCDKTVSTDTGPRAPPELTPFSESKLADLPQFQGQHAEDLLWSTYRPGQYFGEWT